MAINKFMAAALKAISYADIDVKKNYEIERKITNLVHPSIKILYKVWEHKINNDGFNIPVRIFLPKKQTSDEVLLFFHGGGWVTGNIDSYSNVCKIMADNTGRRVASVDYRLAPEYRFPYSVKDCYRVAEEFYLNDIKEIPGGNVGKITLIGDSAGGNLAAVVSLMAKEHKDFSVNQQILFYPSVYFDHSENSPFKSVKENGKDYLLTSKRICDYIDLYIPDKAKRKNPYFAPIISDNLSNQPRTLIVTAEYDPLRDEAEAFAEKLKRFGNDVTLHRMSNALHGFLTLPLRFVHVEKSYELINEFLNGDEIDE